MALLVPTVGEDNLLKFALGVTTPNNQILKLYTNNITPADGDTSGTYTEMTGLGYASITLTKTSWVVAQNSGVAEASYATQTWTFTAGTAQTVYGYFVVDSVSGVLLWAERFATSKSVQYAGDQIKLTAKITLSKI